jgi:predicted nucleic acid-binding protein
LAYYFDSNVLIYAVEGDARHSLQAEGIFRLAAREGGLAATSELAIAECLRGAHRAANDPSLAAYRSLFLSRQRMRFVPVTRAILESSAEIGAATRTKLAVARWIASASACGCSKFVTNDTGIRLAPPGLAIIPFWDALDGRV